MSHHQPPNHNTAAAANAAATAAAAGPPPPPLSALLADAVLEFLEAAVHTVLHARTLYPPEVFERRRLYGSCLCPRARHPGVCAYVASALAALRAPLLRGALQEVAVVVREEDEEEGNGEEEGAEGEGCRERREGRALEKVSFVLHRSAASAAAPGAAAEVPLPDAAALEAAFAAALVKLQHLPQAPPLQQQAAAGGGAPTAAGGAGIAGGAGTRAAAAPRPLPRRRTFEIVGLATSRDGVDRSALMEEDVLEAGPQALLLPSSGAGLAVAGWPLKTIRLQEGGGGNSGGAAGASAAAAATLTILVEARRPS